MKKLSIVLRVVEGLALSIVIWFVGWLLYDTVDLWMWLDAMGFRNTLFILMVISFALVCELTRRSLTAPHQEVIKQESDKTLNNPDLDLAEHPVIKQMAESIKNINKKLANLQAFEPIVQKRAKAKKKTTKKTEGK